MAGMPALRKITAAPIATTLPEVRPFLRYRIYSADDLAAILGKNAVLCSRSSSFKGCIGRPPDTVSVDFLRQIAKTERMPLHKIVVHTSIFGNDETIAELLRSNGFALMSDEKGKVWRKELSEVFYGGSDSLDLLRAVFRLTAKAETQVPYLLYAAPLYKLLQDYYTVMAVRTKHQKITWQYLQRLLASRRVEVIKYTPDEAEQGTETPEKFSVAKLGEDNWAAWVEGDENIPLFPTQRKAEASLSFRFAAN